MMNTEGNPFESAAWVDMLPNFEVPPQRVVSLVPSLTESLFDLGFGASVVGCTDYCIHPADGIARLARVGGPQTARIADILALSPDLVLAGQEENSPELVAELRARGIAVWVVCPRTVEQSIEVLWGMAHLFATDTAVYRILALEPAFEWTRMAMANNPPWRYFCPIWLEEEPGKPRRWMTFNQDTYMADLLKAFGGENVFAQKTRDGAAIGSDAAHYPWVSDDEVRQAAPEVILLPSEPYEFGEARRMLVAGAFDDTPAVRDSRVILLDGSLIIWAGTRLARALDELPGLLGL
jgi:ABC-type Fe3+-hydroxamate transport system substrate-binding protein